MSVREVSFTANWLWFFLMPFGLLAWVGALIVFIPVLLIVVLTYLAVIGVSDFIAALWRSRK